MDQQLTIEGCGFIRKDRMDTQNKTRGGLILYFRSSLNFKSRHEYELSTIETIRVEIERNCPIQSLLMFVRFTVRRV